jgi:predicted AAA+ superfamily ATPase
MSFEEFLMAIDDGRSLLEGLSNYDLRRALPEMYTIPLQNYLKLYYVVGGMPAAVASFVQENDFEKVDRILKNILLDYGDDFSKHAPPSDIPKLGLIWDSVPKQLAKDNNKFMFSHVKAGKRAADLEDALQWLFNAGLLHKLECVTNAELPLSNNANGTVFKVYMSDVGLLRVKSGIDASTILEETPLYATFKGAFTENFVMNELVKQGLHPYFWRSENKAELDFLIEIKNELMPIEVKAEEHTKAKSYGVFCKRFSPKKGFVLSQKNIAVTNDGQTETLHLPLYLCGKMFR